MAMVLTPFLDLYKMASILFNHFIFCLLTCDDQLVEVYSHCKANNSCQMFISLTRGAFNTPHICN